MQIKQLDHLVLTVRDLQASVFFYCEILGMRHEIFGTQRHALHFGSQKINLHLATQELTPHALHPQPGSADLCLLIQGDLESCLAELQAKNIVIESGPLLRTGAQGPIRSIYLRDPDQNLIELSELISNKASS